MAGATLANGTQTYSSTIAAASTAEVVQFDDRYEYVVIESLETTAGDVLWVRTDGQAATVAGANCVVVLPGASVVVANRNGLWYQSSRVIPQGSLAYPTGGGQTTTTNNGQPGMVTEQQSLAGQMANPGTTVSLISATASLPYLLSAAG